MNEKEALKAKDEIEKPANNEDGFRRGTDLIDDEIDTTKAY
jgi:hypothetical protein